MRTLRITLIPIILFLGISIITLGQSPYLGTAPFSKQGGGVLINEMSQGPEPLGVAEYIELVVLADPANPNAPVDLTGTIIDDNNIAQTGQGTANGYISLSNTYDNVLPGSIIVIYNIAAVNPNLPPDDPIDANSDQVYIIPSNDPNLDKCASNPNSNNNDYCPCDVPGDPGFYPISMRNGGDMIQVRDQCETPIHAISYNGVNVTLEIQSAPIYVATGFGNQLGSLIHFTHNIDDNWNNVSNYEEGSTPADETPGAANNAANQTFIDALQTGTFAYAGTIADCQQSDAGDITWPSGSDPGTNIPLEICEGDDLGSFSTVWPPPDHSEPDASLFDYEYAFILTDTVAPYSILEFALNGDFDFSVLPPGSYYVWGLSYINPNESVTDFLNNTCIGTVEDIQNVESVCGYNCGLDVDISNISIDNVRTYIEILPNPGTPNNIIDTVCQADASNYDLTLLTPLINGGSGIGVRFFDGDPSSGGLEIIPATNVDLTTITDLWIIYGSASTCEVVFDLNEINISMVPINMIGPINICASMLPIPVDLTAYNSQVNSDPSVTVTWYFDAAATAAITNVTSYFMPVGTNTVYVQVDDGTCLSEVVAVNFIVEEEPILPSAYTIEACGNPPTSLDLTTFEDSLNADPSLVFRWYEDPNGTSQINSPNTYLTSGGSIWVSANNPGNGCTSDTIEVQIQFVSPPSFTVVSPITVCSGLIVDLDTLVLPSNPSLTYTFHSATPPTSANQIPMPTSINSNQTIFVRGTDNTTSCSSVEAVVINVIDVPVAPPISNGGPYCEGDDIELFTNIPFPIPGLMYQWTGPNGYSSTQEDPIIPNSTLANSGDYELVVTLGGCQSQPATTTVDIIATPPAPVVTSPVDVCQGAPLQLFSAGVSGGVFNWSGPNGFNSTEQSPIVTTNASQIDEGTYEVRVILSGCSSDSSVVEVNVLDTPTLSFDIITEILCPGEATGSVQVNVFGSPPFTFDWNDNQYDGQDLLNNLSAGTYQLTLTDNNGCTAQGAVTLSNPPDLEINCQTLQNVTVSGGSDGIIEVEGNGGSPSYTIFYDNFNGTSGSVPNVDEGVPTTISNLPSGTYTIAIVDENGCEIECTAIINEPNCDLTIDSLVVLDSIECAGEDSASLSVFVSGGSGSYFFLWEDENGLVVGTTQTVTNLAAGTYRVFVTDQNNTTCEQFDDLLIIEPLPFQLLSCMVTQDATGMGTEDGIVELTTTNGTPPYNIQWSGPSSGNSTVMEENVEVTMLAAGTYNLTVTDQNGCIDSCSFDIASADCSTFTIVQDSFYVEGCPSDANWTLQVTVSPASPNVIYILENDTFVTGRFTDLLPGSYNVMIVDTLTSCQIQENYSSDPFVPLEIECQITNPPSPAMPLGDFQINILSASFPLQIIVDSMGTNDTITDTREDTLRLTGQAIGSYLFTVADSFGCIDSCRIDLEEETCTLEIECRDTTGASCGLSTSALLRVQNGDGEIRWILRDSTGSALDTILATSDRLTRFSMLHTGRYRVIAIDESDCRDSCEFIISPSPLHPMITLDTAYFTGCPSDSSLTLAVSVTGISESNRIIIWNQDTLDLLEQVNLPEGRYTIFAIDSVTGCSSDSIQGEWSHPAPLSFDCQIFAAPSSFGGRDGEAGVILRQSSKPVQVQLIGHQTNLFSESRMSDTIRFTGLDSGIYTMILTDSLGCVDSCVLYMPDGGCAIFSIDSIVATQPSCDSPAGGALEVFVSGGGSELVYDWSDNRYDGQNPIQNLAPGIYNVTVTDTVRNCITSGSQQIFPAPTLDVRFIADTAFCAGDSGSLSLQIVEGSAPFQIIINSQLGGSFMSDTVISIQDEGQISIIIRDQNNCVVEQEFTFISEPAVVVEIRDTICVGEQRMIAGEIFDVNRTSGRIVLSRSTTNGCDSIIIVSLEVDEIELLYEEIPPSCDANLSSILRLNSATGQGDYTLFINQEQLSIDQFPFEWRAEADDTYTFYVENAQRCRSQTYSFLAETIDIDDVFIPPVEAIRVGDSVLLEGRIDAILSSIEWSPSDGLSCDSCIFTIASPRQSTTYRLNVQTVEGCLRSGTVFVEVIEPSKDYYVPNTFTPNGDGANDYFTIYGGAEYFQVQSFLIYNRWGDIVYENQSFSPDVEELGWNGTFNGRELNEDVYVYAIEIVYFDGRKEFIKGTITLLR